MSSQFASSQVGINTENPNSLTVLDVNLAVDGTDVIPKGMMVPRMTKNQRDKINVSDPDLANSLLIYNTDEDCFNYFSKTENKWKSICGEDKSNEAAFTIECSQVLAKGTYSQHTPLNSSNFLSLTVTVAKPGEYNISGLTTDENGYYFSGTGVFVQAGTYQINIPGYGTPTNQSTAGDNIVIRNNDTKICDNLTIKIKKSEYTIDCSSIIVSGNYIADIPLTSANTIQISVNADPDLVGYVFDMSTEVKNGYSFSASGVLVEGDQVITLAGSGTPIAKSTDTFILKNNSVREGVPTCEIQIAVAPRQIRILNVSSSSTSYNLGNAKNMARMAMYNPEYFGLNTSAAYPTSGFAFNSLTGTGRIEDAISSFKPDIIFTQYAFSPTTNEISILTDFVNKGGVFIYCTDNGNSNTLPLIKSIFDGNTTMTTSSSDNNNVVTLEDTGTKITDGPFMNLTGLGMARDAGGNFGLTTANLPTADVTVIAYTNDKNAARMIAHKTKGFVFVGDGGPFSASSSTSAYNQPAKFNTVSTTTSATVDSSSSPQSYNSYLFLNLMSWAIDYIKNSGVYP